MYHTTIFSAKVFTPSHLCHHGTTPFNLSATTPYCRAKNSRYQKIAPLSYIFQKKCSHFTTFLLKVTDSCLLSHVFCLMTPFSCLLSLVSCILSPVSWNMSTVSCLLSHGSVIFFITLFFIIIFFLRLFFIMDFFYNGLFL